ncbi:microfibril-associated glycoprotein 4 [Culex quinquefasciatus]|uniref:microfibril-associated glycoprotein 4 n=1 Tax=Culex quinquefasciatus TaxID=7176 RepID=UPI0018E30D10|nr:microfibril-associated glycoprotein 4 [Culex quinquefasciatus]
MASINKLLFIPLIVLLSKTVCSEQNCKQAIDEAPNSALGFELMEERMDKLQFSFLELFVHVKELGELIVNNQRTIEQNLLETRQESSNLMHALEAKLTTNVSLITSYSKQILDYQTICTNHEEIRNELSKLKPNVARYRSRPAEKDELETVESHYSPTSIPKSCQEVNSTTSGVFKLAIINENEPSIVLCDLQQFGGGWLVFQHRFNGSVSFYRNWTDYKNGFGDVGGEFWLGLEKLHQLTSEGRWELAVEMKDFQDSYKYARYTEFAVGSEAEKYALTKVGMYSGTAEDYLIYHKGGKFSTYDSDNDASSGSCAKTLQGAWWFKECYHW